MLDKFKDWVSKNPMMAAGAFIGAGAAITYVVLMLMGKIKK